MSLFLICWAIRTLTIDLNKGVIHTEHTCERMIGICKILILERRKYTYGKYHSN